MRRWLQRSILKEIAGYTSESGVRLLMSALVGVFVARYLGPDGLGLLSYVGSVFALLSPLVVLGMRPILVREFSTSEDWHVILTSALGRQLPVALVTSILGLAIIASTRSSDHDALLIGLALAPLPFLATRDNLRALYEAEGRVRLVVTTGIVASGLASVVKLVAILLAAPIWVFAASTTLEASLVLAGYLMGLRRRARPGGVLLRFDPIVARSLIRESWPLLIGGMAVLIYMRADILMLGLLADDAATGIYVAAARISELWYFVPIAAMAAVRPRLARLHANKAYHRYRIVLQRFMSASVAVALAAVVFTLVFADSLMSLIYGPTFAAAGDVVRIHVLAAPFVFLGVVASQWFIDRGMTKAVMIRSMVGAGLNIAMNLALIPRYGAIGASVATLVSYATAGVLLNAIPRATRPLFWMQVRAFIFAR